MTIPAKTATAQSAAKVTARLENLIKKREWTKLIYLLLDLNASISYDTEDGAQDALITANTAAILVNTNRTFSAFSAAVPGNDAQIAAWVMTEAVTFPADLVGSQVSIQTSATAEAVYSIEKNGTEVWTMTIGTDDSVVFSGAVTAFAAGDVLTLEAPATDDDTLLGVAYSFLAALTVA
jgi:hypothetical protein